MAYPSDLSFAEWHVLEPLLPACSTVGHPRRWPRKHIMDAIFYVVRTGCQWRYLPKDFPPWQTVYYHYRRWRQQGVWKRVNHALRALVRVRSGREPEPSGAIIDSQSARTTEQGGPRGYDGHKKLKGRKRHVLVDTTGLLLKVVIHPADVNDRKGGELVLADIRQQLPRLAHIWADQGYAGEFKHWVAKQRGLELEVVYPWWRQIKRYFPEEYAKLDQGFKVIRRRWVVERTFAWLGRSRRLSKDYERLPETAEALVYAAMSRLMLKRLARPYA